MHFKGGMVAGLIILAVAFPQAATAGPTQPNYPFLFKVPATNGYEVTVNAPVGDRVELFTDHRLPGGGSIGAAYEVKGKVTRKVIRARFGELGRVSVRMKWSGRFRDDTQCEQNETFVVRRARFRGKVRFQGEGGYTSVSSKRPRLALPAPDPVFCGFTLDANKASATVLHARNTNPAVSFAIERGTTASPTLVFLLSRESRGGVRITRYVEVAGPPSAFSFDPSLSSATVQGLPAPFQGSASFQRDPASAPTGTLIGTLSTALAGSGTLVALTGPEFVAKLEPLITFDGKF